MITLTTHILDTNSGKPADGVAISLHFLKDNDWKVLANGITNKDGRISDLVSAGDIPGKGVYKMKFETGSYFREKGIKNFYPHVEITFEIDSDEHYHIPLLLSPFGYTTYRGS